MPPLEDKRSHPPALLRRTERTLREETPLRPGDGVLLAVSGGGDSMALLHVMSIIAQRWRLALWAHGVDHGLRPEAAAELDGAEALAERLRVPFGRSELALAEGGNLQARARVARYQALEQVARQKGARFVATGHHADDRAETVLIRLLRGTGVAGLGVLPACAPTGSAPWKLRPMIRSSRAAIAAHCRRHEIEHASDPSNESLRFLRSRVRHELLPLMEELARGSSERLNRLADDAFERAALAAEQPGPHGDAGAGPLAPLHATQIRRARKFKQRAASIWLPGGLRIRVDPETGHAVPDTRAHLGSRPPKPAAESQKRAPRGAKPSKSD